MPFYKLTKFVIANISDKKLLNNKAQIHVHVYYYLNQRKKFTKKKL